MNTKPFLLALLATVGAHAQTTRVKFDTTPPVPMALAKLAAETLQQSSDMDGCVEYAGVIIAAPDGALRATEAVSGQENSFDLTVTLRPGERLAAVYHTHPLCANQKSDRLFSPGDVQTADRLGVPSFIWVGNDNSLRVFVPHSSLLTYLPKLHAFGSFGTVLGHTQCVLRPVRLNMNGRFVYNKFCTYW